MIWFGSHKNDLENVLSKLEGLAFSSGSGADLDLATVIARERSARSLTRAIDHALHYGDHPWAKRIAERLHELRPDWLSTLRLASILVECGDLDRTETLLASIPRHYYDNPFRLQIMAALRARQGRIKEALYLHDELIDTGGHADSAATGQRSIEDLLSRALFAPAFKLCEELRQRHPDELGLRGMGVRCLFYEGQTKNARELADLPEEIVARASIRERRTFIHAKAEMFSESGWIHECFEFSRDAILDDPTHWSLYWLASECASAGRREQEYGDIVSRLTAEHDKVVEAVAIQSYWYVDQNRIDEAEKILSRLRTLSIPRFLEARLYLAIHSRDAKDIDDAYMACLEGDIPLAGPTITYGFHLYYFDGASGGIERALELLEPVIYSAATCAPAWLLYMRLLIALDRIEEAATCLEGLPAGLQKTARLRPIALFFIAERGEHKAARRGWIQHIQSSRHECINARSSYPETLRLQYRESPGAVLLFAVVYNGLEFTDWFLKHYRELGVDHFFITDNGSTDGTRERLLQEPDVSVFGNSGSFASSACGLLWTNHLMQRFGVGHWCFHVDIDEGFVFPGQEHGRSLMDLLAYMEEKRFGAVRSLMLDMYPGQLQAETGTDPFDACCYFDVDYHCMRSEFPPYEFMQGGLRQRMTGRAVMMNKSPLVRMSADVWYTVNNHYHTHLPVADISTALLHYKFVGNITGRIDEAIERKEHAMGARFYRLLRDGLNTPEQGPSLLSRFSHRYNGPGDLVAHGLMKSSAEWDEFSTCMD